MTNPLQTGTLIALTAASLFAAACKKEEAKPAAAPAADTAAKATATPDKAAPVADKAAPAPEKTAKVHCNGANACKGQGGCKTDKNACSGQNGCKGQGFVETATAEDCTAKGGTVAAAM